VLRCCCCHRAAADTGSKLGYCNASFWSRWVGFFLRELATPFIEENKDGGAIEVGDEVELQF